MNCCEHHAAELPDGNCRQGRLCPERPLYLPLRSPVPTAEETGSWLYVGLLVLLICVTVGGAIAFALENWNLIVAAVGDFWR